MEGFIKCNPKCGVLVLRMGQRDEPREVLVSVSGSLQLIFSKTPKGVLLGPGQNKSLRQNNTGSIYIYIYIHGPTYTKPGPKYSIYRYVLYL